MAPTEKALVGATGAEQEHRDGIDETDPVPTLISPKKLASGDHLPAACSCKASARVHTSATMLT